MNIFQSLFLGITQEISEFLPISSSGHLAILQHIFNIKEGNLFFSEMLHFGTLLSIVVVFRKKIWKLIFEFIHFIVDGVHNKHIVFHNSYQKVAVLIIVATIPAAAVGMLLEDFFAALYTNFIAIGFFFIITDRLLYLIDHTQQGYKKPKDMTFFDAIIVGIMQAVAILPGISRSGSTISGLVLCKLERKFAFEFSFLMALPPIFGAFLLGIVKVIKNSSTLIAIDFNLIVGVLTSFIIGVVSIKLLANLLRKNKLYYFSYYLIPLGIVVILLSLFGLIK